MMVNGKEVARTTGTDIAEAKSKLSCAYLNQPGKAPTKATKPRRK